MVARLLILIARGFLPRKRSALGFGFSAAARTRVRAIPKRSDPSAFTTIERT